MVYRPTVRYDDIFKAYVDDVQKATELDRNQIIRAALFTAAMTVEFRALLAEYRKAGCHIPLAPWKREHVSYWMEQVGKERLDSDDNKEPVEPIVLGERRIGKEKGVTKIVAKIGETEATIG